MPIVSNVNGTVNLTLDFTEVVSTGVISAVNLESKIVSSIQLTNGNGAVLLCDLMYAKQLTLAATPTVIDFSALADPGGTSQNWTGGRVRLFAVQVVTVTANFDVAVFADATNGWAQVPPTANKLNARGNGGMVMLFDPNANGSGNGMVVTSTSKRVDLDPGANTVVVNVMAIGNSVA